MATIITLQSSDQIASSRADINTSLANLNSDKIETSTLDTDTTLAANSDSKIPSQKAVKAYVDTQGGANASETVRGVVEEATDAEVTAGTATGATGAKLFVSAAKLATRLAAFVVSRLALSTFTAGETMDGSSSAVPVFFPVNAVTLDTFASTSGSGQNLQLAAAGGGQYKQAFKFESLTVGAPINHIRASMYKVGSPTGNIEVSLYTNNAGSPGTKLGVIGNIDASTLTGSYANYTATASTPITSQATMWVVFAAPVSGFDGSNYVMINYSTSGTHDAATDSTGTPTWGSIDTMTPNIDILFVAAGGRAYRSDADNAGRDEFHGFLTNSVTLGDATAQVVYGGVLAGFSGLTPGATYYVSNTIGTISTTPGSTSIEVGKAISATTLLLKNY